MISFVYVLQDGLILEFNSAASAIIPVKHVYRLFMSVTPVMLLIREQQLMLSVYIVIVM